MKNTNSKLALKLLFFGFMLSLLFSGCSKKFIVNHGDFINKPVADIILKEAKKDCPINNKNVKLNVTFSDNFQIPNESLPNIGLTENSWDIIVYSGNFKKDVEDALKNNLKNSCEITFDETKSHTDINIEILKVEQYPEKLNVFKNYFIPLIGKSKVEYEFFKSYKVSLSMFGSFFDTKHLYQKTFLYHQNIDHEMIAGLNFDLISNVHFYGQDKNQMYFKGNQKLSMQSYLLYLTSEGKAEMNLYDLDKNVQLYHSEPTSQNEQIGGITDNFKFKNLSDEKLSEMFGLRYGKIIGRNVAGVFSYITYDIVKEVLKNKKDQSK